MISYINEKDEWYTHFYEESTLDEQFTMLIDLFADPPSDDMLIADDFGTVLVETKENFFREKRFEEGLQIINQVRERTPKLYQKEFAYLSHSAVEYYLFKNDIENAMQHLQPYIDNPVEGIDYLIPLFHRLLFYGKTELALSIAEEVSLPIMYSDQLIGGAEINFVDMIFYQLWQNYYIQLEDEQAPEVQSIIEVLRKYDYEEAFFEEVLPSIAKTFDQLIQKEKKPIFSRDEWVTIVNNNSNIAFRRLYWSFAIYMLKEKNIPFAISHIIWFTFTAVLLKSNAISSFQIQSHVLDKEISSFTGGFLSNQTEIGFAVLWGIPYIYDFLFEQDLVAEKTKLSSLEKVLHAKKGLMKAYKNKLWLFDYVHSWEKPSSITDEHVAKEMEMFNQSFLTPPKPLRPTKQVKPNVGYEQLSLFDSLLNGKKEEAKKSQPSAKQKKQKRKQAQKQRKKNR